MHSEIPVNRFIKSNYIYSRKLFLLEQILDVFSMEMVSDSVISITSSIILYKLEDIENLDFRKSRSLF